MACAADSSVAVKRWPFRDDAQERDRRREIPRLRDLAPHKPGREKKPGRFARNDRGVRAPRRNDSGSEGFMPGSFEFAEEIPSDKVGI